MAGESTRTITDTGINKAIGHELRLARVAAGFTRAHVADRMSPPLSVQAVVNYELGIRPLQVSRLVAICEILGVVSADLLALALQRADIEPDPGTIRIDLVAMSTCSRLRHEGVRLWARRRLTANPEVSIASVSRDAVDELATFLDLTSDEFRTLLRRYIPPRTPCRIVNEG